MGGVLIKLGQFLGSRVDVMPEEYIQELGRLHDVVPPVPFEEAKAVVEAEFGRPLQQVFPQFKPEPIAAASLAQVHEATLPTGETVAVKIQRPGIEDVADLDLAIYSYLMDGLDRFSTWGRQMDIPGMVAEFAKTLGDELDFYREGFHAERFRENFEDSSIIYIPRIYWDYTTRRIVTLERVEGIKVSDYEELDRAGIDRHEVGYEIVQSYLQQVLIDGFFHADPHPGNLFVMPGPIITFVDFGMVGEIPLETKDYIRDIFISITKRDVDGIVSALMKLGMIRRGANLQPIRNAISWLFEHYAGLSVHTITYESLGAIQEDIRAIMRDQPFTIPGKYGFLGRAAATMTGLVTGLDPRFDFIEAVKPYVEHIAIGEEQWIQAVMDEAKTIAKSLLAIPARLDDALAKAQQGQLSLKVESTELAAAFDRSTGARTSTSYSIVGASLIAGSVALYITQYFNEAYLLFGFGFVVVALGNLFSGMGRPRRPFS